jgi:hypothetical protein
MLSSERNHVRLESSCCGRFYAPEDLGGGFTIAQIVTSISTQRSELKPVQGRVGRQRLALVPFPKSVLSDYVGFAR